MSDITIKVLPWSEAEHHAAPLRFEVFMQAKSGATGVEVNERDNECTHVVAYDGGRPIGTARLMPDGQIGRMVVVKEWRRRGVGGKMLDALIEEARKLGLAAVRIKAPMQAMEFYRERGFVADGKVEKTGSSLQQPVRKDLGAG
jgi:predicted GNAT family N-acyltransferase